MTPEEIQDESVQLRNSSKESAIAAWLQEIAYQLAVMNERTDAVERMRQKLSGKYDA